MPKTDVSIVVTTKNEERNLPRMLASLADNGAAPDQVIVVDAHSTDRTAAIATQFGAHLLLADPNLSAQRNAGVRAVHTRCVLILDADMELPYGVLDEIAALFDAGSRCIILPERSVARGFLAQGRGFERSLLVGDLTIEAARAFTVALFWEVGGYDEVVGFGGEDWLLARAMYARCEPAHLATEILHYEGDPSVLALLRKYFFYGRGRYRLFRTNPRYFFELTNPIRPTTRKRIRDYLRHPVLTAGAIAYKALTYSAGFAGFVSEALSMRRAKREPSGA